MKWIITTIVLLCSSQANATEIDLEKIFEWKAPFSTPEEFKRIRPDAEIKGNKIRSTNRVYVRSKMHFANGFEMRGRVRFLAPDNSAPVAGHGTIAFCTRSNGTWRLQPFELDQGVIGRAEAHGDVLGIETWESGKPNERPAFKKGVEIVPGKWYEFRFVDGNEKIIFEFDGNKLEIDAPKRGAHNKAVIYPREPYNGKPQVVEIEVTYFKAEL